MLNNKMEHPEYFFWAAALTALFLPTGAPAPARASDPELEAAASPAAPQLHPFQEMTLRAKAAYVYDVKAGRALFSKDAATVFPLASLTKLMTAALALTLLPETTLIPIEKAAIEQEGDSKLQIGERWLLRDLAAFMLLESSNDAAYAIAAYAGSVSLGAEDRVLGREFFVEKMNERAVLWKLDATRFYNETGLDLQSGEAGALSSAKDVAHLLARALRLFPSVFGKTRLRELPLLNGDGDARPARNTNKETDALPLLIASKTGYTDLAGGNLAVAFDVGFNRPLIVVVLGSTIDGRFSDVEKLVWAALAYLTL